MSDATQGTPQDTPQGAASQAPEQKQDGQPGTAAPAQQANATAPEATKTVVPEKYDLKLPEKSPLDPGHLEKIAAFAKERGFSQEEAQAFVDHDNATLTAYVDQQKEQFSQTRNEWVESVKSDKEIGGENLPKSLEFAKRALTKFATPEFISELNETGFGDHPELVRAFARIGKLMGNDSLVIGGGSSAGDGKKTIAQQLYGGGDAK